MFEQQEVSLPPFNPDLVYKFPCMGLTPAELTFQGGTFTKPISKQKFHTPPSLWSIKSRRDRLDAIRRINEQRMATVYTTTGLCVRLITDIKDPLLIKLSLLDEETGETIMDPEIPGALDQNRYTIIIYPDRNLTHEALSKLKANNLDPKFRYM